MKAKKPAKPKPPTSRQVREARHTQDGLTRNALVGAVHQALEVLEFLKELTTLGVKPSHRHTNAVACEKIDRVITDVRRTIHSRVVVDWTHDPFTGVARPTFRTVVNTIQAMGG